MESDKIKRILVVDDSPVVRSFHANILKMSGFKADGACDGVEALEKALITSYHLILCDINMPNMDGITFIQRYREQDETAPIIILTTQEDAVHREKGYKAGANLYLVKPVKPGSLIRHIELLLGVTS
jgi:two-component system chemotaxis response regulator CheY